MMQLEIVDKSIHVDSFTMQLEIVDKSIHVDSFTSSLQDSIWYRSVFFKQLSWFTIRE